MNDHLAVISLKVVLPSINPRRLLHGNIRTLCHWFFQSWPYQSQDTSSLSLLFRPRTNSWSFFFRQHKILILPRFTVPTPKRLPRHQKISQTMAPASNEEQFKFLISCIRYSNNGKVSRTRGSRKVPPLIFPGRLWSGSKGVQNR